jgi:hypothetical protein
MPRPSSAYTPPFCFSWEGRLPRTGAPPQACSTRRARHQPSNKSSSVEALPLRLLWASQRGWDCPCPQPLAREASPPGDDRREDCEVDGESGVEIRHLEGAICVQCANPSQRSVGSYQYGLLPPSATGCGNGGSCGQARVPERPSWSSSSGGGRRPKPYARSGVIPRRVALPPSLPYSFLRRAPEKFTLVVG